VTLLGIIVAILLFILLIVIHEAGHLFASKICGVRVEEFSVGMGPLIYEKQKGETQYSIRAVPIGGYCKLEDEDGSEGSDDPRAFSNAAWWKKVIILAAGAFNNVLLCLIVLFFVYIIGGFVSPTLAEVVPGAPADIAGLQAGDRIVAVNEEYYEYWSDIVSAINESDGSVEIWYTRDGQQFGVFMTPYYDEASGRNLIGIRASVEHNPVKAFTLSCRSCVEYFGGIYDWIFGLFTKESRVNEVVGVVGMVSMASEEAKNGFANLIVFMALISLNLGAVNLLPFPALDGGRILFVILRKITNDRIGPNAERIVNSIGLVILLAFMIFTIFRDTFNLII